MTIFLTEFAAVSSFAAATSDRVYPGARMKTWILILTLSGMNLTDPPTVRSIPGFQSKSACHAAGKQWLRDAPTGSQATYKCVPAGG
jgi:hypothetical protein